MKEDFTIELSASEVIVLNSTLSELTERTDLEALIPHPADRQALHSLVCLLERNDPAVFADDYDDRVASARARILPEP